MTRVVGCLEDEAGGPESDVGWGWARMADRPRRASGTRAAWAEYGDVGTSFIPIRVTMEALL
jgi:hypothetical protein